METMESVEGSVLLRSALFILFVSLSPSLVIPLSEKMDKLWFLIFNFTTTLPLLTSLNIFVHTCTCFNSCVYSSNSYNTLPTDSMTISIHMYTYLI